MLQLPGTSASDAQAQPQSSGSTFSLRFTAKRYLAYESAKCPAKLQKAHQVVNVYELLRRHLQFRKLNFAAHFTFYISATSHT